ncbi:MAG: nucleotidyltransferase family protein, partial [Gammaproteobacteria bacterium]|nr:nucleotidyltransferase family protein [Gammaproteobacteria bacterium]
MNNLSLLTTLLNKPQTTVTVPVSIRTVNWLTENGMGPLLFQHLSLPKLQAASLQSTVITETYKQALNELLTRLEQLNIETTLLKGISIAHQLYPAAIHRPMRDMDILVKFKDLAAVHEVLINTGYAQRSRYNASFYQNMHHVMPYYHSGKNIWLEVHHGIIPPTESLASCALFRPEMLDNYCEPSDFYGHPVKRFNIAFQLIYTSVHWSEKLSEHGGFIAMLDTILLLQKMQARDWQNFEVYIKQLPDTATVALMFSYLDKYEDVDIPENVMHSLLQHQKPLNKITIYILHKLIREYMIDGNS